MSDDMPIMDMKLSKKDQKQYEPAEVEAPKYPYGLTLHLNNETLEKLGIKTLPKVGQEVVLQGVGNVTSVSENERSGQEKYRDVSIQITGLGVAPKKKKADVSKTLYG